MDFLKGIVNTVKGWFGMGDHAQTAAAQDARSVLAARTDGYQVSKGRVNDIILNEYAKSKNLQYGTADQRDAVVAAYGRETPNFRSQHEGNLAQNNRAFQNATRTVDNTYLSMVDAQEAASLALSRQKFEREENYRDMQAKARNNRVSDRVSNFTQMFKSMIVGKAYVSSVQSSLGDRAGEAAKVIVGMGAVRDMVDTGMGDVPFGGAYAGEYMEKAYPPPYPARNAYPSTPHRGGSYYTGPIANNGTPGFNPHANNMQNAQAQARGTQPSNPVRVAQNQNRTPQAQSNLPMNDVGDEWDVAGGLI